MSSLPRASRRTALLIAATLVGVQLGALAAYLETAAVFVRRPRYYLYPIVWITVVGWITLRVRPRPGRPAPLAVLGGIVYLGLLLNVAGTISLGGSHHALGWTVEWLAPGWGPYLAYAGPMLTLRVVPFQLIGYLGLAYLVFVALARASSSALFGAGGLVACVGCAWPALTALSAALGGGGVMAAADQWSYDLSTLVFLATVVTICWLLSERSISVEAGRLRTVALAWRSR